MHKTYEFRYKFTVVYSNMINLITIPLISSGKDVSKKPRKCNSSECELCKVYM